MLVFEMQEKLDFHIEFLFANIARELVLVRQYWIWQC
eukprot:12733.XXX_386615_386725_1 [CDS] Oithona nana genome sequencing.